MSLFGEKEGYTDEAEELDRKVTAAIAPIFEEFVDKGYKIREIEYIMQKAVLNISLESLLDWGSNESLLDWGSNLELVKNKR